MNPKRLPRVSVPKKSPIKFPNAAPHAAAGPNSSANTMGIAFAGRTSVTPGTTIAIALNGISTAAYSAADPPIIASPRMT